MGNETGEPDAIAVEGKVSRRTIVKGAAWTLPVVAAAVALPTASASVICGELGSTTVTATAQGSGTGLIPVPAGATTVTFLVRGGAAGYATANHIHMGDYGLPALISAVIPVSVLGGAGHLEVIAGQTALSAFGSKGGLGYGNGGDGHGDPRLTWRNGSPGAGGGSAILLPGGAPLVVAGGAGSFGAGVSTQSNTAQWGTASWWDSNSNGNAGLPGAAGQAGGISRTIELPSGIYSSRMVAGGGAGGTQTAPGAPGVNTGLGAPGAYGTPGSGRNGGRGAADLTPTDPRHMTVGGAGGGGYFGGGGGSAFVSYPSWGVQGASGGGGGGSSYLHPDIAVAESQLDTLNDPRAQGFVTVSFACS